MSFLCFFLCTGAPRALHVLTHACPTLRSSDLSRQGLHRSLRPHRLHHRLPHARLARSRPGAVAVQRLHAPDRHRDAAAADAAPLRKCARHRALAEGPAASIMGVLRSEEHTSELQSLMRITYDVFCLKKKN